MAKKVLIGNDQPRQGLTVRNGKPVFAVVFTPEDVANAAHISVKRAAKLIIDHSGKFVNAILGTDWETTLEVVVDELLDRP